MVKLAVVFAVSLAGCYVAVDQAEQVPEEVGFPSVTEALVSNTFEFGVCYEDDRGSGGHPNEGVVVCDGDPGEENEASAEGDGWSASAKGWDCFANEEHCGGCWQRCDGECVDGRCLLEQAEGEGR